MKICIPINKKSLNETLKQIQQANESADVIEIWLDQLGTLTERDFRSICSATSLSILYKWQKNEDNLLKSLDYTIEYLDLDVETSVDIFQEISKKYRGKLIVSYHNFQETPDLFTLHSIADKMATHGADIYKFATQANSFSDCLRMFEFLSQLQAASKKAICISMGENGHLSRTAGHLLGNYLMYAPLNSQDSTAPGQVTVKELQQIISTLK